MNFLKVFRNLHFLNSPYLFLYKSQFTSIFSILMRLSGFLLFFIYLFFILFNNNIYFVFNFYNYIYDQLFFFNSWVSYIFYIFVIIFFTFHTFFAIRYILNLNFFNKNELKKLLNIQNFYRSAFLFFSLVIFIVLFLILFF